MAWADVVLLAAAGAQLETVTSLRRARALRGAMAAVRRPPGWPGGEKANVKVTIRRRPLGAGEKPDPELRFEPGDAGAPGLVLRSEKDALQFDHVLTPDVSNAHVFDRTAAPLVQAVMLGVHGNVLFYGRQRQDAHHVRHDGRPRPGDTHGAPSAGLGVRARAPGGTRLLLTSRGQQVQQGSNGYTTMRAAHALSLRAAPLGVLSGAHPGAARRCSMPHASAQPRWRC